MKLERRFDWKDKESVYKAVDEDTVERTTVQGKPMIRFQTMRIDGTVFSGAAYESTVASMCFSGPYWRLAENPKNKERNMVVAANPPLAKSRKPSEKASSDIGTETVGKGD